MKYDGNGAQLGYMPDEVHYWGETFDLSKNLYAREFKAVFDCNDATEERPNITITTVEPMKFVGWSTAPVDVVEEKVDRQTVANLAVEDGAVVTLYAMWETDYMELPVPSREGYIFLGWSVERQEDFPHPGYNTKDKVKALRIGKTVGPLNDSDPIADRENYLIWKPTSYRRLNKQDKLHAMWIGTDGEIHVSAMYDAGEGQKARRNLASREEPDLPETLLYAMWYGTPYPHNPLNDITSAYDVQQLDSTTTAVNFQNFIDIIE